MRRLVILALVLTGCADPPPPDRSWVPDGPLAGYDIPLPHVAFVSVRDVARDGEDLWILDSSPPFLTRVSVTRAAVLARFGARGDGPGELRQPVALRITQAEVVVWDAGSERVVRFDRAGELVGSDRLSTEFRGRIRPDISDVTYVDPWRVRPLGSAVAHARFANGVNHTSHMAGGVIVRTDHVLSAGTQLVALRNLAPPGADALGQFAPMPLWDACDGTIVTWDARHEVVRWTGAAGQPLGDVHVDLPVTEITDEQVKSYLHHMARHELGPGVDVSRIDFDREVQRVRPLFRGATTAVADIRCESRSTAWLQLFDLDHHPLGFGASWVRVSLGAPPAEVTLPRGFRPLLFTDEGVAIGVVPRAADETIGLWRPTVLTQ